ncbi:MAG TPA: hypothetical protein VHE30_16810 [Polyangiaceae bacterium]|nr:hypothetical protein [Polyangiaceae bacterium]
MRSPSPAEARARLKALLGLSEEQAARAVDETLDTFRLDLDEFIATRHAELQAEGEDNPRIFDRIAEESKSMLFRAPELTPRQIRRRIYG